MNMKRSFFPQASRDAHVAEIDRMLQSAYLAGIWAAGDAAAHIQSDDISLRPELDDSQPVKDAYWRGRHASRDAIRRLWEREKGE